MLLLDGSGREWGAPRIRTFLLSLSFCPKERWAGWWAKMWRGAHLSVPRPWGDAPHCLCAWGWAFPWLGEPHYLHFSTFHQKRCHLSGMSTWSHKEIKLAPSSKYKCLVAIRIWNSTFRSHQMELHICRDPRERSPLSIYERHIRKQTDASDGDGQPNLQFLNLQRHGVLSLNIHLGPS